MRTRLPLALAGFCLLLVAVGPAPAAERRAAASADALGVRVVVPGGGSTGGAVSAPPDTSAALAGFSYGEGAVSASSLATHARAASTATRADSLATSTVGGVSLFGDEITVDSVQVQARVRASSQAANGSLAGSSVAGLTVLGKAIAVGPNLRVPLADWGYAVILEQAVVRSGSGVNGRRVFASGLHIHLTAEHGGLPAGSDITVGYAEAEATAPKPPPPSPPSPPPPPSSGSGGNAGSGGSNGGSQTSSGSNSSGGSHTSTGQGSGQHADPNPPRDPQPQPPGANPTPPPIVQSPPDDVKPVLTRGGYVFPVYGPDASFSDDFQGARADTGWHHGNDIFAPLGTPVVAATDGELFLVGVNTIGGNRLWLRDAAGNEFYYAHLSAYSPLAYGGSKVKAGDVIGFVGATGDAVGTPPHLHFEIHPRGLLWLGYDGVVNPFTYLSAWRRLDDLAFDVEGAPGKAPPAGAILLQAQDISTASGLDPAALARALESPALFGEGLASPATARSSSPGFTEGAVEGSS